MDKNDKEFLHVMIFLTFVVATIITMFELGMCNVR